MLNAAWFCFGKPFWESAKDDLSYLFVIRKEPLFSCLPGFCDAHKDWLYRLSSFFRFSLVVCRWLIWHGRPNYAWTSKCCESMDLISGCFSKNRVFTPQIIHFNKFCSVRNHPFWGVFHPLFLGWHPYRLNPFLNAPQKILKSRLNHGLCIPCITRRIVY